MGVLVLFRTSRSDGDEGNGNAITYMTIDSVLSVCFSSGVPLHVIHLD